MSALKIQHFSDLLCVWAYVGQARVDEVERTFGEAVSIDYHFIEVFGDVLGRLQDSWRERGGLAAYNAHVLEVASGFEHVQVHSDIWLRDPPSSSLSCHQFLYAAQGLGEAGRAVDCARDLRRAFFAEAKNIGQREVQLSIAEERGISRQDLEAEINSGRALAHLARDLRLAAEQGIKVSPTLVFNEGRQTLKGNVGYKVIEANIHELLVKHPDQHSSWC